jgi:hypothetical protein
MSKRFDSRRGYEAAMVHVVNGIMRERLGSRARRNREAELDCLVAEMRETFPIPTYRVDWQQVDGTWVPSCYKGMRQEVAEARAARHPHLVSRVVQDGVE